MLTHHRDVGLSKHQVSQLLDLNAEYHDRQLRILLEFAELREQLDLRGGRVDTELRQEKQAIIRQQSELFCAHEELFFEMAERGHQLLTDEQIEAADRIYGDEEEATFATLEPLVTRALAGVSAGIWTARSEAASV